MFTINTQFEITENSFVKINGIYNNFSYTEDSRETLISQEMRNKKL